MSREIPLTRGYVAVVDDEDFEWLSPRKWHVQRHNRPGHNPPYAARRRHKEDGAPSIMLMHREILGAGCGQQIDHIDGNGLNNQRVNLRFATPAQNIANRRTIWGTSGFKGVSWNSKMQRWAAYIYVNYGRRHLGYFSDPRDAALAYDRAALELRGEFACTNAMLGTLATANGLSK